MMQDCDANYATIAWTLDQHKDQNFKQGLAMISFNVNHQIYYI